MLSWNCGCKSMMGVQAQTRAPRSPAFPPPPPKAAGLWKVRLHEITLPAWALVDSLALPQDQPLEAMV